MVWVRRRGTGTPGLKIFETILESEEFIVCRVWVCECEWVCVYTDTRSRVDFEFSVTFSSSDSPGQAQDVAAT